MPLAPRDREEASGMVPTKKQMYSTWGSGYKSWISLQAARAPGMAMMLLMRHFIVAQSAALVDLNPRKSMRLPPTVHLFRYGSALCSL
jgi:hypothetical protein